MLRAGQGAGSVLGACAWPGPGRRGSALTVALGQPPRRRGQRGSGYPLAAVANYRRDYRILYTIGFPPPIDRTKAPPIDRIGRPRSTANNFRTARPYPQAWRHGSLPAGAHEFIRPGSKDPHARGEHPRSTVSEEAFIGAEGS